MAVSSITVSGLAATPGIGCTGLQWSFSDPNVGGLPYMALDAVEVWAATTNDRSVATLVAQGRDSAQHMELLEGAIYYYWIRARDRNTVPLYSNWYPSGSTSGVQGTVGYASATAFSLIGGKLVASVSASALTIAVKTISGADPSSDNPARVSFRNATPSTGDYTPRQITAALSLVISSGSTLGAANGTPFRVWVVLFDDAGTLRLGAINCSGLNRLYPLDEATPASSIAEGGAGASDSLGVFYTGTAVSSKAFRILGYMTWNSGLATAGTWSAGPDVIQIFGQGIKKPGEMIQSVAGGTALVATIGTGVIPFDNTKPQNSEGATTIANVIAPSSPANFVDHDLLLNLSVDAADTAIAAIFGDGVDALVATACRFDTANMLYQLKINHRHLVAATFSTGLTVNAGTAGGATLYKNGISGAQKLGGCLFSHYAVKEYMG